MQINDLRCQASSFRLIHFAFWHSIDILRGRVAMSANGTSRHSLRRKIRSLSERSGQVPASTLTNSVVNDPNVWSGRALQVDFVELAVCGLASMYPASDWSVLCSGPSWI